MPNIGPAPDRRSISASARPPFMRPSGRLWRAGSADAVMDWSPLRRPAPTPTLPRLRGREAAARAAGGWELRGRTSGLVGEGAAEEGDRLARTHPGGEAERRGAGIDMRQDAVLVGRARIADAGARR